MQAISVSVILVGLHVYSIAGLSGETYQVTPSQNTTCPEEDVPCFTLSDYAAKESDYFADNTTLIFLPGNHTLDPELLITSITILTMLSSDPHSYTSITCNQSAKFTFENIHIIEMEGLGFLGCVNNTITSVEEFSLGKCVFHGQESEGNGLIILSTRYVGFGQSIFKYFVGASAISINESSIVILLNCTFSDNSNNRDEVVLRGAAVYVVNSDRIELNTCVFINNSVMAREFSYGGAVYSSSVSNVVMDFCVFENNSIEGNTEYRGGAVIVKAGNVTMYNCTFSNNTGTGGGYGYGGALHVWGFDDNIHELIMNYCNFTNNVADGKQIAEGGALAATDVHTITIGNCLFSENSLSGGTRHGGALLVENCPENIIFSSMFIGNRIQTAHSNIDELGGAVWGYGGAVALFNVTTSVNSSTFTKNEADSGTLFVVLSTMYFLGYTTISNNHGAFVNETAMNNFTCYTLERGGTLTGFQSEIIFYGTASFIGNEAMCGGAISVRESNLIVCGEAVISQNTAHLSGGGIFAYQSELNFKGKNISLIRNKAMDKKSRGGGVHAVSSFIRLDDGCGTHFVDNYAQKGGGVCLELNSKIYLFKNKPEVDNTTVVSWIRLEFIENSADYGGAVYVADDTNTGTCGTSLLRDDRDLQTISISECFIQTVGLYKFRLYHEDFAVDSVNLINTYFFDNSAAKIGEILYGGLLDRCTASPFAEYFTKHTNSTPDSLAAMIYIQSITNMPNITEERDLVTSEEVRICFCKDDNQPDCSYSPQPKQVSKGQTFNVSLVAVDQVNNVVPNSNIHVSPRVELEEGWQSVQQTLNETCTNMSYTILSAHHSEQLHLYADGPCADKGKSAAILDINFIPCLPGFEIDKDNKHCVCHHILSTEYVYNCSIKNNTVLRRERVWISYTENESDLVLYTPCPYDYCLSNRSEPISIDLTVPNGADAQCAFNRSGRLCGSCKDNHSLILGSSRCMQCSNKWLSLLILFALAGIALVAFLLVFNLTVAVGTINGLIFYANIFAAIRPIFLPYHDTSVLTVFIAWLNLDFGFETCFYDGMDGYAKTWLQLVFPMYVLFLVAMVIIISHYSQRFAQILSNRNPVATLATLILLSYTKLLRTIIAVLSFATITIYKTNSDSTMLTKVVWIVDGNIPYFQTKHTFLFIAAVIILLVGVVFSFLLFFWQWLLRWTKNTKLNSFMETYCAPYTPQHRYWTGLLLFTRGLLCLIFAVSEDPEICLFSTICVAGTLIMIMSLFKRKIYKKWPLFALETSFIYNLSLVSAAIFYSDRQSPNTENKYKTAFAYTSISIAIFTFVGILLYHTYAYVVMPIKRKIENFRRGGISLENGYANEQQSLMDLDSTSCKSSKQSKRFREPLDLVDSYNDHVYGSMYDTENRNQNIGVTYTVVDAPN